VINLLVDFIKLKGFSKLRNGVDFHHFYLLKDLLSGVNGLRHLYRLLDLRISVKIVDFFIVNLKSLQMNGLDFTAVILKQI
jgi:hypothetical protein